MGQASDPQCVIGSTVHVKAIHITSEAECKQQYGSNKAKKLIEGEVIRVDNICSSTDRANYFIVAKFDFGGGVLKEARINVQSVKAGRSSNCTSD